jgi:hypothetical protein
MSQTVVSKGTYHGLPTFPQHEGKKYNIIVTGANGISGSAVVKVLSEAPQGRWGKIYALSRRPPSGVRPENLIPIAVDFLNSSPDDIAKVLKDNHVEASVGSFCFPALNVSLLCPL